MCIFLEILGLLGKVFYYILERLFRAFVPVARKSVTGQTVLITGAGGGIGRQLALEFARLDIGRLVLWDINKATNDETAVQVRAAGREVHTYVCDISCCEDVRHTAEQVKRDVGDVDILINNAGILNGKRLMKLTDKDIQRTMDINSTAHFWTTKCFLPAMMERNSGHIVSIASVAGEFGSMFLVDYTASKFAAVGFMNALMMELYGLGVDGVKTTCVLPFYVDTGLAWFPRMRFPSLHPLLTPDYVAKETVDAVLKNETKIFVPRSFIINRVLTCLLPLKACLALNDFFRIHIVEQVPQLDEKQK